MSNRDAVNQQEIIGFVGIDLGTTNTVVSYVANDNTIENVKLGRKTAIPSAIFFESADKMHFGENAINRYRKNSQAIVRLFKRKIGQTKDKYHINLNNLSDNKTASDGNACFVIDTNCFCDCPGILAYFTNTETVYIPQIVTSELTFRSNCPETKYTAEEALKNIAEREKYPCNIVFEDSDLSLIPKDIFAVTMNDENDHKVLSVAIKHINEGVTLITSDNKLGCIKAPSCGVKSISLNNFKLNRIPLKRDANNGFDLTGEQATAYFLRYINEQTCKVLSCDGLNAVITVPVNFSNIQVEATKRAAQSAGFRKVCIEKEPIAAAIAYSMDQTSGKNILIYDFGGGTFDVAIVRFDKEANEFEVLASDGDPNLGGQDITNELVDYIKGTLEDENGLSLFELSESGLPEQDFFTNLQIIENEAERVKQSLSSVDVENVNLSNLYTADGNGLTKRIPITKQELEDIVSDIARKPTPCLERAIKSAGILAENIDVVILSGGTSQMPIVREKVQNFFGKMPFSDKDPATLIANGAAIIANSIFTPKTNHEGDQPVRDIIRKTKVIADIGVATDDLDFDKLIEYGTLLPAEGTKNYYLLQDGQDQIAIKVYSRAKGNNTAKVIRCDYLDSIILSNLPVLKRKDVVIPITLKITEEYEMIVTAEVKDKHGNVIIQPESIHISKESNG